MFALDVQREAQIRANIAQVNERIAAAARRSGRDPGEVRIIAVTKTVPLEDILIAHQAGLKEFGENRVEEAREKIPLCRAKMQASWHMVGHLQRRKVRDAIALFDSIQSVDTVALAEKISRLCTEAGRVMPILLEMNVSGEESKYGFTAANVLHDTSAFEALCACVERVLALPGVRVEGLMTVAPIAPQAEIVRPHFRALRRLQEALHHRFPTAVWNELSMGMTDDFEVAVEEGATIVRLGRAIFHGKA